MSIDERRLPTYALACRLAAPRLAVVVLITVCVGVCTTLLLLWVVLELTCRARPAIVDSACAACFFTLSVTSVVAFQHLLASPPAGRGPMPFLVFLGAPIGLYLAWVSWCLARARQKPAGGAES